MFVLPRIPLRALVASAALALFSAHFVMAATDDDDSDKNKKARKTAKGAEDKSSDETPKKRRTKEAEPSKETAKSEKESTKGSAKTTAKSSDKDKDKEKPSAKTAEKTSATSKAAKSSEKEPEKSTAKTSEKKKSRGEEKDSEKTASKSSEKKAGSSQKSSSKAVAKEEPESKKSADKTEATKPVSKKTNDSPPKDVTDQKSDHTNKEAMVEDGEFASVSKSSDEIARSKIDDKPAAKKELKASSSRDMAGWELVRYGDRDYVTSNSIHRFYRFTDHRIEGKIVWFTSPVLIMKAVIGSQELLINNIKFILSNPVEEAGGKVLFSRMDLCKLIDPVLRPSYIGHSEPFDTVIVDAGHGGYDSGARGLYGYEKNFTLQLAKLLKADLERRGFRVVMTRTDDTFISLGGRVEIANKVPNSIFVSLHFNSGQNLATGIETYALSPQGTASDYGARSVDSVAFNGNQRDSENIALATAIHASVVHHFKLTDRGVKRARWYVLTGLERPGVLFEGGFVTNGTDGQLIAAENFRNELAHTIGDAISNYRRALQPQSR